MIRNLPPVYGLDIAVDADSVPVAAPRTTVTDVALSVGSLCHRWNGHEADALDALADQLARLEPGVVVTWNGSLLVLPLLGYRAVSHGVDLGLRLRDGEPWGQQPLIEGMYLPAEGSIGAHRHLDLRRLYAGDRRFGRQGESDLPWPDDLCDHDPRTDARLLRSMAQRRWSRALRHIDPINVRPGERIEPVTSVTETNAERGQGAVVS